MKRHTQWAAIAMSVALVGVLTAAPFFAQQIQSSKDEVALRAAMERETVRGDLKGAIEQYKKLAESKDRALATRALVRMAESYQKLGDAEAQKVYQRIVREHADQKDALALAQARLGGIAVGSMKGERAVWTGPNAPDRTYGEVSPDGKFITWVDWDNKRVMVHDIAANSDRALTAPPAPNTYQTWSRISTDSKQVMFASFDSEKRRMGFRIAASQGRGFSEPREVFLANEEFNLSSFDWSPDGKWIAAAIQLTRDGTRQIALIRVADGSFRVLKSVGAGRIRFSVDSRYIAYTRSATGARRNDLFVLAIEGSPEIPVAHNVIENMGWSPDGTRLLFSSETGSVGLWALPFADGKAQGPPELLERDLGTGSSLGLTASGTLYINKIISSRDIVIASIDLAAGKLLGSPVSLPQGFVEGPGYPQWSRDRNYLAYSACNLGCIAIRSVATGEVRRLPRTLASALSPSWSPDGRSLLVRGTDLRGRTGVFEVDVQSGEAMHVASDSGISNVRVEYSPDGKKVYFTRSGVRVERDLASGAERDIYIDAPGAAAALSPDGQYFVVMHRDPSTKTDSLLLAPVTGAPPREFLRLTSPEGFGHSNLSQVNPVWTPDSSAVIFDKNTGSRRELWLAPIAGGRARKLDIDPNIWIEGTGGARQQGFSLSPDGRSIAFTRGKTVNEIWALENFLPTPAAKK